VSRLELDTEPIDEEPSVLRMPAVADLDVDEVGDIGLADRDGLDDTTEVEHLGPHPHLHLHRGPSNEVDLDKAAGAVADLLDALGVDRSADGLEETPARVAHALAEMLSPEPFNVTTFANDEGYDELVVARAIPFASLCEHHLLPFSGLAHVGYLPNERLVGLSKLARVVDHFSRRLQVQERLTAQVANFLQSTLQPKGVGVVLEAEHLCMSLRGARAGGSRTVTSALKGLVRDDQRTRAEFLLLAGNHE
jgi:GTP cyclohydrolase I